VPIPNEQAEPIRNEAWTLTIEQIRKLFKLRNGQMRRLREKLEAEQRGR
jgi:hypothetical protein